MKIYEIEKCSSPIGDGNWIPEDDDGTTLIEKCSSPIGDGNIIRLIINPNPHRILRNVAPR